RCLSLIKHPKLMFLFKPPMGADYDCNLSFALLQNQVTMSIQKKEEAGDFVACVNDTACTHRAIFFCKAFCLPVMSGGLASNQYIIMALKMASDATELHLLCPPSKLCTKNGVMVAWYELWVNCLVQGQNDRFSPCQLRGPILLPHS
uniref:Gcp-like domain-containing protein n=1 Tax=Oncorhynchus kisutch TaxID=8019 RepID=A0A8C7FM29_ONCKI